MARWRLKRIRAECANAKLIQRTLLRFIGQRQAARNRGRAALHARSERARAAASTARTLGELVERAEMHARHCAAQDAEQLAARRVSRQRRREAAVQTARMHADIVDTAHSFTLQLARTCEAAGSWGRLPH